MLPTIRRTIYCDLDGTVADFDTGFKSAFGREKSNYDDPQEDQDWLDVRNTPGFYAQLPPMPDYRELWDFILPYDPIILTGVPKSVPEAAADKRAWVDKWLGCGVRMITCRKADKWHYCHRGDILIDDSEWLLKKWVRDGDGIFILHTSAKESVAELRKYLHDYDEGISRSGSAL